MLPCWARDRSLYNCLIFLPPGFADFGSILCDDHKIDGSVLLSMTEEDLLLPLLNLRVFGDVRRLSMLLDNVRYPELKLSCLAYLICFYRFEEPT